MENCGTVNTILLEPGTGPAKGTEGFLRAEKFSLNTLRFRLHRGRDRIVNSDPNNPEGESDGEARLHELPDREPGCPDDR